MKKKLFLLLIFLSIACTSTPVWKKDEDMYKLIDIIAKRLALADQVALIKWHNGQRVEDREREQQVVSQAKLQAQYYGLDQIKIGKLMIGQIEASKRIQYALLAQWRNEGMTQTDKDLPLLGDIRSKLDILQHSFFMQLAETQKWRRESGCSKNLDQLARVYLAEHKNDELHAALLKDLLPFLCMA